MSDNFEFVWIMDFMVVAVTVISVGCTVGAYVWRKVVGVRADSNR